MLSANGSTSLSSSEYTHTHTHTQTQAQGTTGEQWLILWKELALEESKMRAVDGRRWQNSEMASFSVCVVCVCVCLCAGPSTSLLSKHTSMTMNC